MENLTYQRMFDAFNACAFRSESPAANDFKALTATPETTLNTFATLRSIGTPAQFQIHRTSYVRGLIAALRDNTWNETHAPQLINVVDWLISLQGPQNSAAHYLSFLRILVATVQQKLPISKEKAQTWGTAIAPKTRPYFPKFELQTPVQCYRPIHRTSAHTQNLSADDRN